MERLVGKPHERAAMSAVDLEAAQKEADRRMREHWSVEDGVLVFDGQGDSLCTAKDYGDFELYCDWKIQDGGDSGIYIRGLPQIQIWDSEKVKVGSGGLYNNKRYPSKPLVMADKPVGEWNTFYVSMIGSQVTVKLNGKLVVDNVVLENLWEPDKPVYPAGQIELQNHSNPLWFRNIFVREMVRANEIDKIVQVLPKGLRVQPKARRKVLIFTRATGFRHDSIPYAAHALQLLGQVTGAYDAFVSDELISFEPDVLHQLDTIVLCNTTENWIQPNVEDVRKLSPDGAMDAKAVEIMLRQSLLDFVANGGGLVGIHSASDANYHWAEFGQLVGGYFDGHPWHEQVWMNVERPDHPLSAAFDSSEFSIVDEIYQVSESLFT